MARGQRMKGNNQPVRVLQVIGAMDRGGAETLIMNLYRSIDRNKIQFDFLVNETHLCDYDDEIAALGGRIFHIPRFNIINYFAYRYACRDFFSSHSYPLVHGHIGLPCAIYLSFAHKNGAYTIAHSHAQNFPLSLKELAFRSISHPVRNHADYFIACSKQAGIDRFGIGIANDDTRFHILKNGFDVQEERYQDEVRTRIRKELGISSDTPVFGHVGRLTPIKNHTFLFDVFASIKRQLPNSILLLAGRGEAETNLRRRANQLGLEDSIRFLGVRDDVSSVLCAMDVFIFPSITEGLSNAVIEAQASGLPCLISTGVPELAKIRDQTERLELSLGPEEWSKHAIASLKNQTGREFAYLDARKAGFDIADSASWLENFYLEKAVGTRRF